MRRPLLQRVRAGLEGRARGEGRAAEKFFVYRVRKGRAADIARVLRQALGLSAESGPGGAAEAGGPAGAPSGPVTGLATPTQIDNLLRRSANAPRGGAPPPPAPDRNEPLAGAPAPAAAAAQRRPPATD